MASCCEWLNTIKPLLYTFEHIFFRYNALQSKDTFYWRVVDWIIVFRIHGYLRQTFETTCATDYDQKLLLSSTQPWITRARHVYSNAQNVFT